MSTRGMDGKSTKYLEQNLSRYETELEEDLDPLHNKCRETTFNDPFWDFPEEAIQDLAWDLDVLERMQTINPLSQPVFQEEVFSQYPLFE